MIHILPLTPADAESVSALVREVFDEQVAPSFQPAGIGEMHDYASARAIAERSRTHLTLVAWDGDQPAGVLEVRGVDHVSMLFVRSSHTGHGIATALLARAEAGCRAAGRTMLTVNSSLNAEGYYARQGFVRVAEPQQAHGFSFVPMEKAL
jgi:putative acetyltransferase